MKFGQRFDHNTLMGRKIEDLSTIAPSTKTAKRHRIFRGGKVVPSVSFTLSLTLNAYSFLIDIYIHHSVVASLLLDIIVSTAGLIEIVSLQLEFLIGNRFNVY